VTELESKLEELIARVDQTKTKQDPYAPDYCPKVDVKNVAERRPTDHMQQFTGLANPAAPQTAEPRPGNSGPPVGYDTPQSYDSSMPEQFFGRGLLSVEKAHSLLTNFRGMCSYFPFVILPAEATVQSIFYERPFLLLSVLTAASSREKKLQHVLEEELRSTLSTKVVLDGDKSLDLLQGLLVYLAWFVQSPLMCSFS